MVVGPHRYLKGKNKGSMEKRLPWGIPRKFEHLYPEVYNSHDFMQSSKNGPKLTIYIKLHVG